jgi:DNA-binding transcriptional LysR family regulator
MVQIDTRELEHFVAVAEELRCGRAAARLSVAQPAVSKTIRHVESRPGFALFIRSNRRVSLTPSGILAVAVLPRVLAESAHPAMALVCTPP